MIIKSIRFWSKENEKIIFISVFYHPTNGIVQWTKVFLILKNKCSTATCKNAFFLLPCTLFQTWSLTIMLCRLQHPKKGKIFCTWKKSINWLVLSQQIFFKKALISNSKTVLALNNISPLKRFMNLTLPTILPKWYIFSKLCISKSRFINLTRKFKQKLNFYIRENLKCDSDYKT